MVTAFADSSLLALNSQYSPRMQEAMQIGIGDVDFFPPVFESSSTIAVKEVFSPPQVYQPSYLLCTGISLK